MATVTQAGYLGNQVLLAAGQTQSQTVILTDLQALGQTIVGRQLVVTINISAFTSGTLTATISGVTASGYTYTMLASAALGSATTGSLSIGPGITTATNTAQNAILPGSIQVAVVLASTPVMTYGVDYYLGN